MCFDYEQCTVGVSKLVRARKERPCTSCRRPIKPGDMYQRLDMLAEGTWEHCNTCEGCLYIQALIEAEEISNGCDSTESWCHPTDIIRAARDYGWSIPGFFEPGEYTSGNDGRVVRFADLREARA